MTDYTDLVERITCATQEFDQAGAATACEELIARIGTDNEPVPVSPIKKSLSALRNKRYFTFMESVAVAAIASGQREPQLRRQQAQGLIDQGKITAAISALTELIVDTSPTGVTPNPSEHAQARGLLGRANKQAYVNALNRPSLIDTGASLPPDSDEYRARAQVYGDYLRRAITEYWEVYRSDPDRYLWHGINTVACVCRADRDGLRLEALPDAPKIAEDILALLNAIEPRKKVEVWDRATAIEACVALNRMDDALGWLEYYVNDEGADAFEFGSTLRQLTEVWQLSTARPPGSHLLPVLHCALLRREGGSVELTPSNESASLQNELQGLEAVLGDTRFVPLQWYKMGLERCDAVARIENRWGQGFGSGFLVRGEDLNPAFAGQALLLTNAHVISDDPDVQKGTPPARPPEDALVRFEARDIAKTYAIKRIVWTSPPKELDATLLELECTLPCEPPYPLAVGLPVPTKDRVYIVGHPKGAGLSLSIQDNRVIDVKRPKLHYRAPTEPGSSGSPVFDHDWKLVAIHHAGKKKMPKLVGTGTVEANEGIWISAIVEALKNQFIAT